MITPRFILYLLILLTVFLYGAWNFARITTPYKYLVLLVGITFCSEVVSRVLSYTIKTSFPTYYFFSIIQFLIILIIQYKLTRKKILFFLGTFVLVININILITADILDKFPSDMLLINSFTIVFFSLYGLYIYLGKVSVKSLVHQSWFWIFTGNLLFFSTTFLFFALINVLKGDKPEYLYLSVWIMGVVVNVFYFIAIKKNTRNNDKNSLDSIDKPDAFYR